MLFSDVMDTGHVQSVTVKAIRQRNNDLACV
jgi:hypothetical protein